MFPLAHSRKFIGFAAYVADLIKCQIPQATPPNKRSKNNATAKTANLNFLYRFLSGGANELCGK